MPTFTYRAYNDEGIRVCGCKSARSEEEIKKQLEKRMLRNYDVFESKTNYSTNNYKQVSPKELSIFSRQMSVMFFSHITLMEGVQLLSDQTENKQLKIALNEIYAHMDRGYTLAEAMGMYENIFGSYFLNMIFVGESSGTLDVTFVRMSEYFDKESRMRKKLKSAVTYPAILTVLMTAIVLLLIVEILPMFENILHTLGSDMTPLTLSILSVSSFISTYIWVIVLIVAAVIVGLSFYIKTEKGRLWFDKVKLTFPLVKYVTSRSITARFSRSLSILLKSGVQLVNALEETKTVINNKYLEPKFDDVIRDVKNGTEISEALKKLNVFPPLFIKMVFIGQSTGHIDDMLDKSSSIFDDDVDEAIERLTTMIEPVLIIVLSVIVGIILVSVMIPMIDIMNSIG